MDNFDKLACAAVAIFIILGLVSYWNKSDQCRQREGTLVEVTRYNYKCLDIKELR